MTRRLPMTQPPMPRVIHYVAPAELAYPLTPAQLAARQRRDVAAYARWKSRQAAIAERDRRVRRFWLGFGASTGLVLLLVLAVAGWFVWSVVGLGVLAVPVLIAGTAALAVGGHRCITIVQHWH